MCAKKMKLMSLLLSFFILFLSVSPVSANSQISDVDQTTISIETVNELIATVSSFDQKENPYLQEILNELKDFVSKKKVVTLGEIKAELNKSKAFNEYKKVQQVKLARSQEEYKMTQADAEQLARVDKLAKEYYDYYKIHNSFPADNNEISLQSAEVGILRAIGLSFTESGLATRLVALGTLAALDGPLPVLDFIALVGAAVVIGAYAYNIATHDTAIVNNIASNEGTTYKREAEKSVAQTKTLVANQNQTVHFIAEPRWAPGGGIIIGSRIDFATAALRASLDQNTYSYKSDDARRVAASATDNGASPVWHRAHINTDRGYEPLNKDHWHSVRSGIQMKAHHWHN